MMELSRVHAIGPRRPDLDKTELRAYEEEVKYLETRSWTNFMGGITRKQNNILREAKETK